MELEDETESMNKEGRREKRLFMIDVIGSSEEEGFEEIMADHVHQEMTRNWILVYLRLFLFISIKDLFLALISFPNKSKNLMDSSLPAMKDIHFSDSSTRTDYEMGKLSRVRLDFSPS